MLCASNQAQRLNTFFLLYHKFTKTKKQAKYSQIEEAVAIWEIQIKLTFLVTPPKVGMLYTF